MPVERSFWEEHYRELFARGPSWLDYSNERVQLETFGLCIDASGGVAGRRCLDVGCGRGQLARALLALGAEVTAVDLLPEVIHAERTRTPAIDWRAGNLLDESVVASLPMSERVFALEVLQCVPWRELLDALWTKVAPGGRLVAMVPNGECPIVARVIAEHAGVFSAPRVHELAQALDELTGDWSMRGLTFATDQRIAPYAVSPWTTRANWSAPPNRLQFVAVRGGGHE